MSRLKILYSPGNVLSLNILHRCNLELKLVYRQLVTSLLVMMMTLLRDLIRVQVPVQSPSPKSQRVKSKEGKGNLELVLSLKSYGPPTYPYHLKIFYWVWVEVHGSDRRCP